MSEWVKSSKSLFCANCSGGRSTALLGLSLLLCIVSPSERATGQVIIDMPPPPVTKTRPPVPVDADPARAHADVNVTGPSLVGSSLSQMQLEGRMALSRYANHRHAGYARTPIGLDRFRGRYVNSSFYGFGPFLHGHVHFPIIVHHGFRFTFCW